MTSDDELDGELRRLFGDERLDVVPPPGTADAVVAGARRIRRRRAALTATGGALTAVLLVAAGLTFGTLRSEPDPVALPPAIDLSRTVTPSQSTAVPPTMVSPESAPPNPATAAGQPPAVTTRTPTSTSKPSPTSLSTRAPVSLAGPILGPAGYSKLKLGMSFDAAEATGMLAGADTAPTSCTEYQLSEGASAVSSVLISPADGLLRFDAGGAHTPENIKVGSTLAQLKTAYKDLAQSSTTYTASTGSGGSYVFYVDSDTVVAYQLIGSAVTC